MSDLFSHYGLFLLAVAVVLFLAGTIEARVPVTPIRQVIVARYPWCLQLLCVVMLVFCLFFALALASVQRDSLLLRLGIWSALGVPSLLLSAEVFGRRVTLSSGSVSRWSFYQRPFSHQRGNVAGIAYDNTRKAFRVLFADGATLHLPIFMRGSQQVVYALTSMA
jgi:hypothetical protein